MKSKITAVSIVVAAIAVSGFLVARAQVSGEEERFSEFAKGANYPIAELGGCQDQAACKDFCDQEKNVITCVNFAENKGLLSAEDAALARQFSEVIKTGGPGGCKDKQACEAYCESTSHLEECLGFVEQHNFIKGKELEEMKKIAQALKEGAQLPGGCTDKKSCQAYCEEVSHGTECLDFAAKAGFMSAEEIKEARLVLPLLERGESPGGCKTKESCEAYCQEGSHMDECVNFAVKVGFMSEAEAEMARKTGGKGPGNCRSKQSCEAYCNAPENQEACFAFAKEHDLIPPDKLKEMEEGMGRLRSGLDQAPAEVRQCLKDQLGEEVISKIENGTFMPSQAMGEKMRNCFESMMPQVREQLAEGLKQAPPETLQCLEAGLGADGLEKIKNGEAPNLEMGDVLRNCFESMREQGVRQMRAGFSSMPEEVRACIAGKLGNDFVRGLEAGEDLKIDESMGAVFQECSSQMQGSVPEKVEKSLDQAPPEVRDCIKQKMGNNDFSVGQDLRAYVTECMQNFRPQAMPGGPIDRPGQPGEGDNYRPDGRPEGSGDFQPQGAPPERMGRIGEIPSDYVPAELQCAAFNLALTCADVPEQARELCKKCKGE